MSTKKPPDFVSAYTTSKNSEVSKDSQDSFDSGTKQGKKIMTKSDAPERNNYYEYADPKDAQDAYDSLQAENEMRVGMKKGGRVKKSLNPKRRIHPNW